MFESEVEKDLRLILKCHGKIQVGDELLNINETFDKLVMMDVIGVHYNIDWTSSPIKITQQI